MFGKKKQQDSKQHKIILGMVILQNDNSFDKKTFQKDIKENYRISIKHPSGDSNAFVFKIDGEVVIIGHMPVPIPWGDIEGTAKYAYNWETASDDLKNHKSHLIVSVTNGGQDQIKRFKIFTQVICKLLKATNSLGVYLGNQSLLIPKEDYIDQALLMTDDHLPLNLWIYFGYRVTERGNCAYTYGLREFDKSEMEVIDSFKTIPEISKFLFNMTHYVLDYDVTFKDGQTCGMSEDEKIGITFSKGQMVEGDTFKLAY